MKAISFFTTACFAVLLFSACGNNDKGITHTNDSVAPGKTNAGTTVAAEGTTVYEKKCTMCHGSDGKAGVMGAADLSTSKMDHAAMIATVKNGKGNMKAFGSELTDAEIESVVKFAEGLRK